MGSFYSMKWEFFILFFFGWFGVLCSADNDPVDPELLLDIDQLLRKHGYPVEVHEIATDDGYILTAFRLPHGKNGTGVNPKPIIMMHGMLGTSFNFVYMEYTNNSMAGYFADNGYDVWLANTRGTPFSRHVTLQPNKRKYWKFSWHEIGLHDLPALVDYVLKITEKPDLNYIGHSQGGTIFYVLSSLRPEYQKKFAQVSLMSPGGFMKNFNNTLLKTLSRNHRMLWRLAQTTSLFELPPRWLNLNNVLYTLCVETIMESLCKQTAHNMYGGESGEFDDRLLPMVLRTLPSISTRQALHYAQNIDAGRFRQWDFGKEQNLKVYGQEEPPEYPVEKIKVPVVIYYSDGDNQAFSKDEQDMCQRLRNCVLYKMPNSKWNHFDYVVSKNSRRELHEPLIKNMEKYERHS